MQCYTNAVMEEKKRIARVGPVLRNYATAALRYRALLAIGVAGGIGVELAGIISPLYLRDFVNLLSATEPSYAAVRILLLTLGIFATINFIGWLCRRSMVLAVNRLESRAMSDLYENAFEKLLRHSHDFFVSNFTGTLTRRVSRYARSFEQVFDNIVFNFMPALVFASGTIIVLSSRNSFLGGGLLIWTVVFVYAQFRMAAWLQPLRAASTDADSKVTGALSDAVLNHSAITAFAALTRERKRFADVIANWFQATKRSWDADAWVNGVQGLLAVGIEVALLAGAVLLWQQGVVTVGDFVLIQVYIIGLMDRIWGIGRNMRQLYDAFADASEMLDIIEKPLDIQDRPSAKALSVSNASIVFNNVSFRYGDSQDILQDLNLTIAPHEKVALVGPSGAGKSTITKLLLRLYDVTSGTIQIDGQAIPDVTQESLRNSISLVPQDPVLFHRTLMENIRYGREGATDAEVIEASKKAHCYEFISRYSLGFETMVGERGVKLSGGERQRVAIARAIVKNAPILILDEATSSLDSESEALIQDALAKLMEGKTVIAIAHRLSTVMKMDRIIVMEGGRVVLDGTHNELLSQGSNLYKKLWEIQAGGFITK